MKELPLDPISIDVGQVLQGSVASLYAHLVTRPTGRAVRMAIETQLQGLVAPSVTLIDLSEVVILDFSCADEVVAKLLQRHLDDRVREAFFVFRGVREPHRNQIETVLERHGLAAVAETEPATFSLLGVRTEIESAVWQVLEQRGSLGPEEVDEVVGQARASEALESLGSRRLAFRVTDTGRIHALSRLIAHLL